MVPRAVLMKSGLVSLNTARQVNTAHPKIIMNSARPMTNLSKTAHSTVKRPIHKNTTFKNSNFNQRVNTVKDKNVNTVRPKAVVNAARPKAVVNAARPKAVVNAARPKAVVNAARPNAILNAVKGNQVNAVKASTCWVWKPKTKSGDGLGPYKKLLFLSNVQGNPQMDLQDKGVIDSGCSRHMTGNMSYLTDYEEIDGGYVAFGGNPKGGKITGKGGLTCLFAKATSDESELWHRRLGHINFKTMNKLVKGNLVRGLPSKLFENNQTCVACQKGKQHRASYDYNRFSWVFFLATKDETSGILKSFITRVENLIDQRVKLKSSLDARIQHLQEMDEEGAKTSIELLDDPNKPELEDIVYSDDDKDVGAEADMNNLDAFIPVSPILTTRVHKDHPVEQIIKDLNSAPQTRRMTKNLKEHGLFSSVQQRTNDKDFRNCLFACLLSQEEPKKVIHALKDPSWLEAMQEELLQFKLQEVWTLVELPNGKRAISTKWVFKNKKNDRGIVIKNKARLVTQGYTQEEGIDYDEVFTPVARIKAIRLFLAYASFKDFVVYQMDVKSAFLYGKIEKEVYVCQPPGFEDPDFPDRVYKVKKALYGLHQAPRAWYETLSTYLLDNRFQRGIIDKTLFIRRYKGLQVKQKEDGILISQDKYVTEILKKFSFTDVKTASTPMETQKPLLKDEDGEEVNIHLYRSMIGSLMYLTSSRPDIMFAVCACARYQVNQKISHLHVVKRIFRYLKGQPKLGLWYQKDSPFDLVAYTNSDYAGASLDRKSIIGGCQFLRCRLISWQSKKQTVVANSTIKAEEGCLEWNGKAAKDGI
ncbi:putative ribonuclease H-like domain-containing protein [Tanacetum coccineum]